MENLPLTVVVALEDYDKAVKELDGFINAFYAPYQLDEPITAQERRTNERYYGHARRLKDAKAEALAHLLFVLRRVSEGVK
jgi:hypothetical protein